MRKYCPEVIKEVKELMDKYAIIKLKEEGHSNREVARLTGMNRKTVARYWNEYQDQLSALGFTKDVRDTQDVIVSAPEYDSAGRRPRKYTSEIDEMLDAILAGEDTKAAVLGGSHKQKLTGVQIHGLIVAAGHDIGLTVIRAHIREKRNLKREAFIKQEYEYGQRLEYDFGEVRLVIGGIKGKYHIAVLSSPAVGFRWAYLYRSQKKEVFLDSHARFFEKAGGVYGEVVYDNMKNVVTRFIGRGEKQLDNDLIKMSLYYGFDVNVTNCFSGNEKGHVEGSVKIIRNKVFAPRYRFDRFEEAEDYLQAELLKMNAESAFEEECGHLRPYRPPLELAKVSKQNVDKYSFVRIENNFYSVPDYLVGREVTVKNYISDIDIYAASGKVCSHKKKMGFGEASVEIMHYLDTLKRKPGALKNSAALKCKAELKELFDTYFTGREKEFIELLSENRNLDLPELICQVKANADFRKSAPAETIEDNVTERTRSQLAAVSALFMIGKESRYVN
jgi:transposase